MPSLTPTRRAYNAHSDDGDAGIPLGLASLRLTSSSSEVGRESRDREVVSAALVFALELDTAYDDTQILDDSLELEARVRDRLLSTEATNSTDQTVTNVRSSPPLLSGEDTGDGQSVTSQHLESILGDVEVTVLKGECSVSPSKSPTSLAGATSLYTVLGIASFSSFRASHCALPRVYNKSGLGAYVFEVQLHTSGIMQVGWVTQHTRYTFEDGVGDSADSFAYDGKRVKKWNEQSSRYGEEWTAGDVIGCCIDYDADEVKFFRNGKDLGVAFEGALPYDDSMDPYMLMYPAVSLSQGECCEINLGNLKFQYEYEGFDPVVRVSQDAVKLQSSAKYVFDSLERLTIVGQAKNRTSPRAAAAMATAQAEEYFGLDEGDDEARLAYRKSLKEPSSCDVLMGQAQVEAARALVRQANAVFHNEYLLDSLFMDACRRMNNYDYSGQALYRFLEILAKGIGDNVEMLRRVARIACRHATRRVMGNIWNTGEDPEYCEAIVCSFVWQGFMKTPQFAQAWISGTHDDSEGDSWQAEFERFFFLRMPTPRDMAELVPTSTEGDIEDIVNTLVYSGDIDVASGLDVGLVGIVSDINRYLNMRDDVHAILLEGLLEINMDKDEKYAASGPVGTRDGSAAVERGIPGDVAGIEAPDTTDGTASQLHHESPGPDPSDLDDYLEYFRANQVTLLPREQWLETVLDVMMFDEDPERCMPNKKPPPVLLRQFMQFIVEKNKEVNREVVPAGVSNSTVICSLLSFMVRASRRFLRDVHLEGAAFEFPTQVFLRGMRSAVYGNHNSGGSSSSNSSNSSGVSSSNRGDSLAIHARLGGGVPYLCKSSIVEACNLSRKPLLVPEVDHEHSTDWSIPMEMRPRAVFMEGTPEWSWWILDQCFILFHLGGSQSIKRISTFMAQFEAAMTSFKGLMATLTKIDEAVAEGSVVNDRRLLEFSMNECRGTMMNSLRMLMWHLNWLMPRWKQQTYNVLAGTMARVLLAMQRGFEGNDAPQIPYVADFYIEGVLDMCLACRSREATAFVFEGDCLGCFESSSLELSVRYLNDDRVVSPKVENALLNSLWMMLRDEDTSYFISRSEYARTHLFPALVAQFAHPRNWIHASNCFHLLVQQNGVAQRIEMPLETPGLIANRVAILRSLKAALAEDSELAARLFNALIDRLNWVSPEVISILEEVHHLIKNYRPYPHEPEMTPDGVAMNYRRALAACDLTYHLMRLCELACQANPGAVLNPSTSESQLLTTRMAELVGWALLNFGKSSHAFTLASEIHAYAAAAGASGPRLGPDTRDSMVAEILGPYVGMMVALHDGSRLNGSRTTIDATGGFALHPPRGLEAVPKSESNDPNDPNDPVYTDGFESFCEQIYELGVTVEVFRDCVNVVMKEEWSRLGPLTPTELSSVYGVMRVLRRKAERRKAAVDPPDDFLDPILNVLMNDPVILPSGVRLDRKTIQRHLSHSATDPYTQVSLREEDLVDDVELRKRVRQWLDDVGSSERDAERF